MLAAALTALLLTQAPLLPPGMPPPGGPGQPRATPPASQTARLFFLAGDPAKAMEWAKKGLKKEPKVCKPMIKALAEYGFLASQRDDFTPEQARDFIAWDRKIAPKAVSKLTEPTVRRFVDGPLARAEQARGRGDLAQAERLVEEVLVVDPRNAEARALKKALKRVAQDGGARAK